MKELLMAVLALIPSTAFAWGVDLSWNGCVGEGAASLNKNFVCTGAVNQNYDVEFQYKSPIDIPHFVSITAYADIGPQGAPLSPFWHYEGGGCNGTAIKGASLIGTIPLGCEGVGLVETWDGGPSGVFAIAAYGADYQVPGRGHFILLGARGDAVPVTASANYWAFKLRLNNHNRFACPGCGEQKVLLWQTARIESNDGSPAIDLSGADKFTDCVTINGASLSACGQFVPVHALSWGRIKTMYR